MLNFKKFTQNLHESIPKFIQDFTYNLDAKIHAILNNQINRMNFINREEFELQLQILSKIQENLNKLETKLNILEKQCKKKSRKKLKHK